jgi:hypothetical protein
MAWAHNDSLHHAVDIATVATAAAAVLAVLVAAFAAYLPYRRRPRLSLHADQQGIRGSR